MGLIQRSKKMVKLGASLVPEPPPVGTGSLDSSNWADILKYRNQLVEARNAQLEYQQNVSDLHSKIRKACTDLSKKDNNIKENMEVLALERGRLSYLRDELARRAEELARREAAIRSNDPKWVESNIPERDLVLEAKKRDKDKENAFLLEMDIRRRSRIIESTMPLPVPDPVEVESVPFQSPTIPAESVPVVQPRTVWHTSPTVLSSTPSSGDQPRQFQDKVSSAEPRSPPSVPLAELNECLDAIWEAYSSVLEDSGKVRLMSLPNLLRLCTDGDFVASTAQQIEIFLDTVREHPKRFSLIERSMFLELLMRLVSVGTPEQFSSNEVMHVLFKEYLFPLSKRMAIHDRQHERQFASKHPPLPVSRLGASKYSS